VIVADRRSSAARPPSTAARRTLLAIHIASSVGLLGSSIELLLAASRAATRSDPRHAHTLYELIRLLTYALGVPPSRS
jgi:hypothetical protein